MSASDDLRRGRDAFATRAWAEAGDALGVADNQGALGPEDLELLATALFMLGREDEYYATLERAHHGHLEAGAIRRSAYCAFWVGMQLFMRGESGRGGGWLGRAHRLLEDEGDCVEHGYLLLPEMFRQEAAGDIDGAVATAAEATEAGRRFGDRDLFALGMHSQGSFLVSAGRLPEGLRLLDEAMLAVTAGEVSPIPSGIVYAARSTVARRRSTPDALRSGRRRCRRGATFSPTCSPSPATATSIAPRSCSCTARGPTRSKSSSALHTGPRAPEMSGPARRPHTGVARSCGCAAISPPPRTPTARRHAAGASPSPVSRCCVSHAVMPAPRSPRSAGC